MARKYAVEILSFTLLSLFILAFMVVPLIFEKNNVRRGQIKLLAVSQTEEGYTSNTADLFLEIRAGQGRVFIDTYPITKIDTQMSARFAKEIACNILETDCELYDFIYTIRANSPLVGGPSGGAAITMLTISVIEGLELNSSVAVTGTINSGGLIGPVGGVQAKISGAEKNGLEKVLIPVGSRRVVNSTNHTIDLYDFGREIDVEVVEVGSIDDVLFHYTGKPVIETGQISIESSYAQVMSRISSELCGRSRELLKNTTDFIMLLNYTPVDTFERIKKAQELVYRSEDLIAKGQHYSGASVCFNANVNIRTSMNELITDSSNRTINGSKEIARSIKSAIERFDEKISQQDNSVISDLETYMIVKERLIEAREHLKNAIDSVNDSRRFDYFLAYSFERLHSAKTWHMFRGLEGARYSLDNESLKSACLDLIREAEQRYEYVQLFTPYPIQTTQTQISRAKTDFSEGSYELCIFKASKARSELNLLLTSINIDRDQINSTIDEKLRSIRKIINGQISKGLFPIIGYSYYEYSQSLRERDQYSALIFAEYAMDLSNLDVYFRKVGPDLIRFTPLLKYSLFLTYVFIVFLAGFLSGLMHQKRRKIRVRKRKIYKR